MLEKLKNKSNIALFLVVILSIISFFVFNQRKQENKSIEEVDFEFDLTDESKKDKEVNTPEVIIVDVKGEVKQPGIYEVASDMRVHDVINLADGLTKQADQDQLNLAEKVMDEMIIHVPAINHEDDFVSEVGSVNSTTDKIKLNQASVEDLVDLTGIGPSKAAAIIDYREEIGMFKSVDDLLNVAGIGEKTLDAIREEIQAP